MTRRDMLVGGLAFGLAGFGWLGSRSTASRGCRTMTSGEPPLWEQWKPWERIARGAHPDRVENEAVKLVPGDPRVRENYHALALGDARYLAGLSGTFFSMVREKCDFSSFDDWDSQKEWLEAMFRSFFNCDKEVGWVSLVMARRPSQFRHFLDSRVRISQAPNGATPRPVREAKYLGLAPLRLSLAATEFSLVTKGLRFSCSDETVRKSGQVFAISVPRVVHAPQLNVARRHYREVWVCLGQASQDEERLQRGEIPAVPPTQYRAPLIRVRSTPILSLAKVNLGSMRIQALPIEIDPRSGEVLSLRRTESDLSTGLILWGPGESEAITRALRAVPSP
jgi:hypothetical protein